ncbi:molybdenum cofactor guanylyltransferase [Paenibacillus dakarensis]|uniref:molybdenum cofactor guanylyltransferase n=1 Tax=Paenibacillus dakarensis TaxID=1527293 RepID=UPI0006D55378|nr:molybdenum cofactor guanylyltransferase [Paenibacillus dakarensis]
MTGVILAGGRNSRMSGQNKAFLKMDGELFVERQIREMRKVCKQLIIIANDPFAYDFLINEDIICVPDIYTGHGPLSGFHAAFSNVDMEYAWVVGCDYPMLSAPAAQYMLSRLAAGQYDAVIPIVGGMHQMLHGVYRPKRLLPLITDRLETRQYRLSGLLDGISWRGLEEQEWHEQGIDTQFAEDVDTTEQYAALLNQRNS